MAVADLSTFLHHINSSNYESCACSVPYKVVRALSLCSTVNSTTLVPKCAAANCNALLQRHATPFSAGRFLKRCLNSLRRIIPCKDHRGSAKSLRYFCIDSAIGLRTPTSKQELGASSGVRRLPERWELRHRADPYPRIATKSCFIMLTRHPRE